jgi:hypothetical protein
MRADCFDLKQNGQFVTNWRPWYVNLSDGAGNKVMSVMLFQDNDLMRQHNILSPSHPIIYTADDDYKGYYLEHGLWPNESAWHLRMLFTRTSGFTADEILTLTNLPVRVGTQKDRDAEWTWESSGDTNLVLGDYTVNGVRLKLFVPILYPDQINQGQTINVIMKSDPSISDQIWRMTVLKATDDQGRDLWAPFSGDAGYNCSIDFLRVKETKSLSLQFALHKSRIVEFDAKPELFQKTVSNK